MSARYSALAAWWTSPETREMLRAVRHVSWLVVVGIVKVLVAVLALVGALAVAVAAGCAQGLMKGARRPYNRRYWQSGGAWR